MSDDEVLTFAEDFRENVAKTDFGGPGHITCSVGVSNLNNQDTFKDVFDRMDEAMYYSKKTGKNKVTIL